MNDFDISEFICGLLHLLPNDKSSLPFLDRHCDYYFKAIDISNFLATSYCLEVNREELTRFLACSVDVSILSDALALRRLS